MLELLHAGSLAATGVGACCVALDREGPRIRSLVLSVVMTVAMFDVVLGLGLLPVVTWSALTVLLAVVLAVRRPGARDAAPVARMRVFSGIGAVLMAVLMLTMSMGEHAAQHHGVSSTTIGSALVLASAGYAAASGLALRRTTDRLGRLQLVSMAGSIVLLGGAHLVG